MTLSEWWNRIRNMTLVERTLSERWTCVCGAFWETANLIALVIVIVPSLLTWDGTLFEIGMAVEGAYLVFSFFSTRYSARLKSRVNSGRFAVTALDRWLLVVSFAGFIFILFFGFGKHLLSHPWPYLTHAEGWETGAIIWTALFLLYYLFKFRATSNPNVDKAIIILMAVVGYPLVKGAWSSMREPITHVTYILAIGACFFFIDLLIWQKHPDPKEQSLSRTSFFSADVPMVVSFLVLLGYLCYHRDTEHPEVFVSGVVSCQLLISNAVFVVMEFGLLQPPKVKSAGGEPRTDLLSENV